jgi:hypothetical protein
MDSPLRIIDVYLVEIGEFVAVDFKKLAKILNNLQKSFRFLYLEEDIDELKDVSKYQVNKKIFCDPKLILAALVDSKPHYSQTTNDKIIVGITGVWMADVSGESNDSINFSDCYFGYWTNELGDTSYDKRFSVISTAPWLYKYENLCFRDIYQYMSFMLVSFLGDYLHPKGLTHPEFRWCAYDYNPDLDSICDSIKKSRICKKCERKLNDASMAHGLEPVETIDSLRKILTYSRRPKFHYILRAYQDNPVFTFFVTGLMLSIVAGCIANQLTNPIYLAILTGCIFFSLLVFILLKEHFIPGGKLG